MIVGFDWYIKYLKLNSYNTIKSMHSFLLKNLCYWMEYFLFASTTKCALCNQTETAAVKAIIAALYITVTKCRDLRISQK